MPETNLWEFQHLVIDLRDEGSAGWGGEELVPWLEQRPAVASGLHAVGRPENHRNPVEPDHDLLTGLYALGRLVDVLISPREPVSDDPALLNWTNGKPWWSGPEPLATA